MVSNQFLGRQVRTGARSFDAYGSCQDGIFWIDNHDMTFTHDGESNRGWAPLDLLRYGILGPAEVEPFFYLVEARSRHDAREDGSPYAPRGEQSACASDRREDGSSARGDGSRNPAARDRDP